MIYIKTIHWRLRSCVPENIHKYYYGKDASDDKANKLV